MMLSIKGGLFTICEPNNVVTMVYQPKKAS